MPPTRTPLNVSRACKTTHQHGAKRRLPGVERDRSSLGKSNDAQCPTTNLCHKRWVPGLYCTGQLACVGSTRLQDPERRRWVWAEYLRNGEDQTHGPRSYVCQTPNAFICVSPNAFICVSPNVSTDATELASLKSILVQTLILV